jgi:DNA-binding CsgD family transcriptional regulator/PAS domain-containing protein
MLLGLIDQAYAAAESPPLWERFLVSLAESTNARSAGLLQHDGIASGAINVAVRVDPAVPRLYDEHFSRLDPWAAGAWRLGPGVVASDEMLVPHGARRTEYFNDFAVRYDVSRLLTVILGKREGMSSVLSILRGNRDQPFEPDDQYLVTALVPHVQRSLEIHQRLIDAQRERAIAVEALDAVRCAVFLVDADTKVILANRRGREMLGANDGLTSDRSRLTAADSQTTTRLRQLCAAVAAARSRGSRHPGGMLALERPSDRPALQALVTPAASADPLGLHDDRVIALVFVSDPADEQKPSETLLRELYGLTPSEAYIAARIAIGRSLGEIAAERGSALETVRRQSKEVLAKTGARHRAELVRRLLMVPRIGAST